MGHAESWTCSWISRQVQPQFLINCSYQAWIWYRNSEASFWWTGWQSHPSLGIYNMLLKCITLHFKETWDQNIWALVVLFLSNKVWGKKKKDAAVAKTIRNIAATLWSFTCFPLTSLIHRRSTGHGGTWRKVRGNISHLFLKLDFQFVIGSLNCTTCVDLFHSWHTCITPLGTNGNDERVVRGELPPKTAGVWTRL